MTGPDEPDDQGDDLLERLLADPDPRVRRALDETAGYVPPDPTAFDW